MEPILEPDTNLGSGSQTDPLPDFFEMESPLAGGCFFWPMRRFAHAFRLSVRGRWIQPRRVPRKIASESKKPRSAL